MKDYAAIFEDAKQFAQSHLRDAEPGHDILHIERVFDTAMYLACKLNADLLVVGLASLLHDVGDAKFHQGNETIGPQLIRQYLENRNLPSKVCEEVLFITEHFSFRKSLHFNGQKSIEFQIVQVADRLDAMGAIGIARAFSFGAYKKRAFYQLKFEGNTKRLDRSTNTKTVNHFYEKLLLLKDLMNTDEAKMMAQQRHEFMLEYLRQFYREINADD